jgi:hypothetical protein
MIKLFIYLLYFTYLQKMIEAIMDTPPAIDTKNHIPASFTPSQYNIKGSKTSISGIDKA